VSESVLIEPAGSEPTVTEATLSDPAVVPASNGETAPTPDQIELLSLLADYAQALFLGEALRGAVLRLARRLVQDPGLTDEEAVRLAGSEAFKRLKDQENKK
jgi:hypothetical protein